MKKRILTTAAVLSAMIALSILPFQCKGQGYNFPVRNPGYGSDSLYNRRVITTSSVQYIAGDIPLKKDTTFKTITFYGPYNDTVWAFYIVYIPHPQTEDQEPIQARIVQYLRRIAYQHGTVYFDETGTAYDVLYYQDYENKFHWAKEPCPFIIKRY